MLRTTLLLGALTGVIMAMGNYMGGSSGMTIAFIIAVVMNFGAYWFSDKMVLRAYSAREVTEAERERNRWHHERRDKRHDVGHNDRLDRRRKRAGSE